MLNFLLRRTGFGLEFKMLVVPDMYERVQKPKLSNIVFQNKQFCYQLVICAFYLHHLLHLTSFDFKRLNLIECNATIRYLESNNHAQK